MAMGSKSKKTQVLLPVALLLIMALLAAVASAGRVSFPLLDVKASQLCYAVGACSDRLCKRSYHCGKNSAGSCQISGRHVQCCCNPRPPIASANDHPLVH
ncbi:hypothetical protein BDA96_05G071600 [Sorghum bicolor]|uniref:Knottin scorpion toxin-like domain-containing protein n=2 Tax=Sorghum bicolor TaxID=4558 RepID=A0A921QYF0_SORBI|nr:hypothetical protein BDA96_05G071600 [Sorghum bicolor]KXG27986.1 hypothetical protein SORBI_3005G071200 [Sorghum bicolor]